MRRNLLLAHELAKIDPRPHVLLISGATESMHFRKPPGVDVLTLPALTKIAPSQYGSRSLGLELSDLIALRSAAIRAAADRFTPDVLIVDNVPRGAERELDETLALLRERATVRIVLGLRDVLDDPIAIAREWRAARNEEAIEDYFDAVWVYGDPAVLDVCAEYEFAETTRSKLEYVGYLDRSIREGVDSNASTASMVSGSPPYVLCLVGGGEDGAELALAFSSLEPRTNLRRILVLGPFQPERVRRAIHRKARYARDLEVTDFAAETTDLIHGAACVVSMGGHNAVSEILSFGKRALIVPRIHPRREQWIRANRLARLGLLETCEPSELSPDHLQSWIEKASREGDRRIRGVDMNGLQRVRRRVEAIGRRNHLADTRADS